MKLAAVLICCCCWASVSRADTDIEVYAKVTPSSGTDAPHIVATIIGAPKVPANKLSIAAVDAPAVSVHATSVRSYAEGTEPIAIVLVVEGHEIWMGNDDIEKDATTKYRGALKPLAKALDGWKLAVPSGSAAGIVTYADTAKIRLPFGNIKSLSGKSLGSQKDYYHTIGTELVAGVSAGIQMLTSSSAPRKLLVVIGDGNDTNADAAKSKLAELKKTAAKEGIKVSALVYKSQVSDPATVITALTSHTETLASTDAIAAAFAKIKTEMDDRYYVTFPGYDSKTKTGLSWDGKSHDLVITVDGKRLSPTTITLDPKWAPSATK